MTKVLQFGPGDAGQCRFAVSPVWETVSALRVLREPHRQRYHLPWLEAVRPQLQRIDVAPLTALTPRRGYTPDFLAPPPAVSRATIAEEIDRIKATPLDRAAGEIALSLHGPTRDADPVPASVEEMLADPAAALDTVTAALRRCWDTFVAPHWGRLSDLLDADIAYRTRQIGDKGLRWMLADLHPAVGWHGDELHIDRPIDEHRHLGGAGLVLMPSVFVWPSLAAILDPPWQPTLVYPARGIAELWQPAATDRSEGLARLLGATRAMLLASLAEPASTSALARRHGLSPATVSEHLSVLEQAGLLAKRRRGKSVLYRQTDIGAALTGAETGPRDLS